MSLANYKSLGLFISYATFFGKVRMVNSHLSCSLSVILKTNQVLHFRIFNKRTWSLLKLVFWQVTSQVERSVPGFLST